MANRPENTITYEGFRVSKFDFEDFKKHIDNFSYAFMGRDGNHIRPFIMCKSEKSKYTYDGIILEVEADGIVIKGWGHDWEPQMETITADWKELLNDWLIKTRETWVLDESKILAIV